MGVYENTTPVEALDLLDAARKRHDLQTNEAVFVAALKTQDVWSDEEEGRREYRRFLNGDMRRIPGCVVAYCRRGGE